jgi:hypothetical protein
MSALAVKIPNDYVAGTIIEIGLGKCSFSLMKQYSTASNDTSMDSIKTIT